MSDEKYSWSGLSGSQDLIGRKKVDWSIFTYGTHVPLEFHEGFKTANGGVGLNRGEKHEIELVINGKSYSAMLVNIDRKGVSIDTLQIRYESNAVLRGFLKQEFQSSFEYLQKEREKKAIQGDKSYTVVPDNKAEYIEFYKRASKILCKLRLRVFLTGKDRNKNPKPEGKIFYVNDSKGSNQGTY